MSLRLRNFYDVEVKDPQDNLKLKQTWVRNYNTSSQFQKQQLSQFLVLQRNTKELHITDADQAIRSFINKLDKLERDADS